MAILGDLLVQGRSRFLQKIYAASLDIGEDTTIAGTLTLSKTNDAIGTSNNSPALVVGGTATTAHLELDSNEIMAKTNGTTAADIYINADGGVIYLSKSGIETQVRGNLRVQGTSTFTGASTHSGNLTVSGTTSLAGTSISSDLNVANNAKVNGILTVEEEIRSPKWIIDNIANLGGEFIIAPTIVCENNTSVNISGPSNNLYTITVTDGSITSDTFGGIAWSTGSVVKVSGTINDTILVSINGTMTRALNQTTGTIQFTVSSSNITLTAGTYTGTKVKNLHIMMYKVGNVAPVGIFMTSYGQSHYPYIDIYSGTTSGSFYSPTTRLGYLNGLTDENGNALKINDISPTGWGLYTSNGYFSGTIVSTSGKIGGFTLNTNAIYNGTTSLASTNAGVYLGTTGIRNYKDSTHYVNIQEGVITALGANITGAITATSGEIGGFAIDSSSIHTKNVAVTSNADNSISLSSTDFTRTINDTSRAGLRFAIGDKFGITGDGILYTDGANIININANNISTGTVSVGILPESVKNENIEIGGRNLLYDTSDWSKWAKTAKATSDGDVLTCTNTDTSSGFQRANGWFIPAKADVMDREITISFDAKKTDATNLSTLVFQMFTTSAAPKSVTSGNINEGTRVYQSLGAASTDRFVIENASSINATTWTRVSLRFIPSVVFNTAYTEQTYLAMYIGINNTVGSAQFRHIKAEYGNRATDWTPAPEDQTTYVDSSIDGISIGGRNLLLGAATQDTSKGNQRESVTSTDDTWLGCTVFRSSAAWADIGFNFQVQVVERELVKPGDILTYSIWAKTDDTATRQIYGVWISNQAGGNHMSGTAIANLTDTWVRYEKQIVVTEAMLTSGTYGRATRFECNTSCTNGKYIYWAAPKLEKGTRATDWTPAPEDVNALIDTASQTATNYIYADSNGIKISQSNPSSATTNYMQITSNGIKTIYNSTYFTNLTSTGLKIHAGNANNPIASYGSSTIFYEPGTTTVAAEVDSNGINVKVGTFGNATNKITVGTGTSGHSAIRYGMTTLADTTNTGFYIGTDGMALGKGVFKVTAAGALVSTSATITGTVNATAGYFGSSSTNGWQIDSNAIKHGTLGSSGGYILNASGNSSVTINGGARTNLALAIGSKFGVGNDGTLYTNGANITNINANNINAGTLNIGYLPNEVKNENIEIGGRNLLPQTDFTSISKWENAGGKATIDTTVTHSGHNSIKLTAPYTVRFTVNPAYYSSYIPGKQLMMSFWVMSPDVSKITAPFQTYVAFRISNLTANGAVSYQIPVSSFTSAGNNKWFKVSFSASSDITSNIYTTFIAETYSPAAIIYLSELKLEYGNKTTDWTPAPEDVDESIANAATTATTYITHVDNNGITIHPSSTTNNRVAINANGMQIYKGNVDIASYGDTARIGKTNSSRFLMNADSLQAYNSNNVKYFEVNATGMSYGSNTVATIQNITDAVNGISVSGRNLFRWSDSLSSPYWTAQNTTVTSGIATVTKVASGDSRIYQMPAHGYWTWEANTEYVASIEARKTNSDGCLAINPVGAGKPIKNIDITTEWKRYEYAFVSAETVGTDSMSFYNNGSTGSVVEFRYPKLEKGNKATEWTLAPEDVKASIANAATTATNYITNINNTGIKIHPSSQSGDNITDYALINADGMEIFKGGTSVANFGTSARIGRNNESHIELDYHSLQLIDKEGNSYFHVSDLRDSDGNIAETRYGDGVATVFSTNFRILALRYVLVDGVTVDATYRLQQMHVTLSSAPTDGAIVEIVYLPDLDKQVKAYTLGTRASDIRPGPMSVTLGSNVYAVGTTSVAEGTRSVAIGECSHAEGYLSKAQGDESHAEGYLTTAKGSYSHAQNKYTIAVKEAQTTIGTYNIEDTATTTPHPSNQAKYGQYAFIVGNGIDDSNRSNAFTVDWSGIPSHCNPAGTFGSIFDLIYPIGAIYISTVSTDPSTLFGGTWERITGRFLLAATDDGAAGGNSNAAIAAGNTGGEATHTLTPDETATKDHTHTMNHGHGFTQPTITVKRTQAASSGSATYVPASNGANSVTNVASASGGAVTNHTGNTGGQTAANGSAHNNMPPYLAVYVWKRTA